MLTADQVTDIAQHWADYSILQELAASHEELRADLEVAQRESAALVEEVEDMAQADCLWRQDYVGHHGGTCLENHVFLGCLSCRARRAIANWKEAPGG